MAPGLTLKRSFSESDLDLDSRLLQPRGMLSPNDFSIFVAAGFSPRTWHNTNFSQACVHGYEDAITRKAKKPNIVLALIASFLTTGCACAFLNTFCKLPPEVLAAILGMTGIGTGKAYYDADKAETVEAIEHKSKSDVKLGLKPETVSAASVLVSIVSFADDPIPQSWLPDYVAVPLALAAGLGVLAMDCWKNRAHPITAMRNWWKDRQQRVIPQDEKENPEEALDNWSKLSPELRTKITALSDFTAERICGGVEALIFGGITGGAAYATLITTFTFFSLAAITACPPLAIALVVTLAVGAAVLFYNRFMNGVKRAANQALNEVRKEIGLKPVEIKHSSHPLIMVVSTVLGVISLITNPIGKIVDMAVIAAGTAFVHFFALFGVKNRAVERVNLVGAVKKELVVANSKVASPQLAEAKIVVLPQPPSAAQKLISANPSSFFALHKASRANALENNNHEDLAKIGKTDRKLEPVEYSRMSMGV